MIYPFFKYIATVLIAELSEDLVILKSIITYHTSSIVEHVQISTTKRKLITKMKKTNNYKQWRSNAIQFDNEKHVKLYKEIMFSTLYDYKYILHLKNSLKQSRRQNNLSQNMHILRSHSFRNIGGILNPELYNKCYLGTKKLIVDFRKELILSYKYIKESTSLDLSLKIEFFAETRHAYGRTALCLSGGAILGLYHFGVIKALYEQNLLPRIVTGSSAGSLVAALFCTKPYDEIPNILKDGFLDYSAFDEINDGREGLTSALCRLYKDGYLKDRVPLAKYARDNTGDITFQEAYDKTGWILNITVTGYGDHENYRVMNYLTAPNVLIWSAAVASCGIPYIYGPVEIYCKNENNEIVEFIPGRKFVDGSIGADLPMQKISELFNVNCFIVSQTNPFYIPFQDISDKYKYKKVKQFYLKFFEKIKTVLSSELKTKVFQMKELGILPNFLNFYTNLITQNYIGNVTISPKVYARDYWNIMQNPSEEEKKRCMNLGERYTFEKLNYISYLYEVEKNIEYCYQSLKFQQNELIETNINGEKYFKKKYKRVNSIINPRQYDEKESASLRKESKEC